MFTVKMTCENRAFLSTDTYFLHKITVDAHSLLKYWKQCENELLELHSISIIRFCVDFIESLHNKYVLIGEADSQHEPWRVSNNPLEDRDISYFLDGLYVISDIFLSATVKAQVKNPTLLKGILSECLCSESVFLRKIALVSIRETDVFTHNQKLNLILKNRLLISHAEIQQTKKLVCSIFDSLNSEKQSLLLHEIEKTASPDNFEDLSCVYSYFQEIKRQCKPNKYVGKKIEQLDAQYDFSSYFRPVPPPVDNRFHMNADEIISLNTEELKSFFSFVDSNRGSIHIYDLMDEITKAAEREFQWTYNAILLLIELNIIDQSLWNHMLYAVRKTQINAEEYYVLLKVLANPIYSTEITKEIAELLYAFLRLQDNEHFFAVHEEDLFLYFSNLWENKKIEETSNDILQVSLNSSLVTFYVLISDSYIYLPVHRRYHHSTHPGIYRYSLHLNPLSMTRSICLQNRGFWESTNSELL